MVSSDRSESTPVAALGLRPFDARSLALSVLLGLPEPQLSARSLVALAELFGLAPGTMRTALSRMTGRGELVATSTGYRLGPRYVDRKAAQDSGRHDPAPWNGDWWMIAVSGGRELADRRAFRTTMRDHRFGEVRPEVWLRPANLDVPPLQGQQLAVRGPLLGRDGVDLVAALWPLDDLARRAVTLLGELDRKEAMTNRPSELPDAIVLAASVVRFLRDDPILPPELAPPGWPADRLRTRYRSFDRALGRLLRATVGDID